MNTQLRLSSPLFGTSKIARAVLTGILAFGLNVAGLSSASANPQSSDATLSATSTIKSQGSINLGTPDAVLASVTAGDVTISAAKAANSTGGAGFVTSFIPTDAGASTSRVVKYGTGEATTGFATDTTYSNEAITDQDFFIVEVTAADSSVLYYKIIVTVSAPVVVSTAAVAGVTAPVTGATPVTSVTATAEYQGTVTWSPAVSGTFAAATTYTATVTLTEKAGYTLTGVAANFFTVAGTTSDTNPINSGVITAVFPATAAAEVTSTAATVSSPSYSAADAAAIRAANEAAAKAEAEKLAAAKAQADAKAAADAAAKAAAERVAREKAGAEKAAAEKVEAEARAAAEAIVKAEEAKVAAAEAKAAEVTVQPVVTKLGTKLTLDLPDKYYGKIVTVYVGTTVKGKTTYKKLDYFVLDKEDGTATISSKVKLAKGQTIRINVGKTVVKSLKVS
jgi:putative transposon-encoded protein